MALQPRRVLEESIPIAAILLAWSLLSVVGVDPSVQFGIFLGGLIMATLYAVVRGFALAAEADPAYRDTDAESVLEENGRVLLAAGPWFLAAVVLTLLLDLFDSVGFSGIRGGTILWQALGSLVQALAFTGAVTVLLVAVASGKRALNRDR